MRENRDEVEADSRWALTVSDIYAGYGGMIIVNGVSLKVGPGEIYAIFGPNGAGKTTLLSAIAGIIGIKNGGVCINERDVTQLGAVDRVKLGLCLIPENKRGVFRSLTVRENLVMQRPPWLEGKATEDIVDLFPAFATKMDRLVGSLSGGEQQMVALFRAYLSGARILLLDEMSMGLAPKIVDQVFESVRQIAAKDVAVVIVEQFVGKVLGFCDYACVLSKGRKVMEGPAEELDKEGIAVGYFGDA